MLFSENGIPLGTSMYQFYGNSEGAREKGAHKAIPLEKKKSYRWILGAKSSRDICKKHNVVHICDREADIYELFQVILDQGDDFVIRLAKNRILKGSTCRNTVKILDQLDRTESLGQIKIDLPMGRNNKPRDFTAHVYSTTIE